MFQLLDELTAVFCDGSAADPENRGAVCKQQVFSDPRGNIPLTFNRFVSSKNV